MLCCSPARRFSPKRSQVASHLINWQVAKVASVLAFRMRREWCVRKVLIYLYNLQQKQRNFGAVRVSLKNRVVVDCCRVKATARFLRHHTAPMFDPGCTAPRHPGLHSTVHRSSKPCFSSVLTLSSVIIDTPHPPCSHLSRMPQLLTDQPWRYRDFRSGHLRYHAVRAPRDLHDMHGTGGVHGVAAFDGRVAGHALHSPEREGKRAREIPTRGELDQKNGVDGAVIHSGGPAYIARPGVPRCCRDFPQRVLR